MKKILVIQPLRAEALALFDQRDDVTYQVVTDFSPANILRHSTAIATLPPTIEGR